LKGSKPKKGLMRFNPGMVGDGNIVEMLSEEHLVDEQFLDSNNCHQNANEYQGHFYLNLYLVF
jgi:hypothetical protein